MVLQLVSALIKPEDQSWNKLLAISKKPNVTATSYHNISFCTSGVNYRLKTSFLPQTSTQE